METFVANQNAEHADLTARIIASANDLNYWGKRLGSSKLAVVEELAEQYATYALSQDAIQAILNKATKPKPEKVDRVAKEKKPDDRPVSAGTLNHAESIRPVLSGNRFLISSAQNNTEVHREFLINLEKYAGLIGAQIVIFPFLYNKNGFQNGEGQETIWYDPSIEKYLQRETVWLGDNKKVAAMAYNILPTVKAPLSGMREAIGTASACIVPHATIAHECVPILSAQYGREVPQLYSTGTVTQRNYIKCAAGAKAENRHNFGALIVEFNNAGVHWVRQIETDESGNFQDMQFISEGATHFMQPDFDGVLAINFGDIHAEKTDSDVAAMQWGSGSPSYDSMLDLLRPEYVFAHDLLDFEALNHHNRDNHFHMAKNQSLGRTVEHDLRDVSQVLGAMYRPWCNTVVVRSNHDDALDRWLQDSKYEPRKDPANALTYYQLQVRAYSCVKQQINFVSLPYALSLAWGELPENLQFLAASESFVRAGIEFGEHGHSGINGSRGSPKQFSSNKCNTGHTHSSSIYGGCYTAGVSARLAQGYNETGASSWVHSSIVTYKNGFRTIVHLKDDGMGSLAFFAA